MQFKVDFITYRGVYSTIQTSKLNVPTPEGRRTILSNHMPIMLPLVLGVIETEEDGKIRRYVVNNGVLYFENNVGEIVADNVISMEDINVERAQGNLKKAEERLAKARKETEIFRAREMYDIATCLLKAAEKYAD